ncbi:MAG: 50S ribosomal protein L10 [Sedimentisphaerales bacterium]|nr:50S ribosomal protein L10 [Sedimentisphaerales bacterium]
MSRLLKGLLQKDLERRFAGIDTFLVINTKGIGGIDNNQMRGDLLAKGIRLTVVKNSLMRKAMESMGHGSASGLFSAGPCTVAYGGDSIVDVAKELADWAKKISVVEVKGAYVEGQMIGAKGAQDLAKMPTRAQLQGQLVGIALSPGAQVAGAVLGPGSRIAGCLKSLIEKREKEAA